MFNLILFWGVPLLFALLAKQSKFFHVWRFLFSLAIGIYLALWTFPALKNLADNMLSRNLLSFAASGTLLVSGLVFTVIFFHAAVTLSSHGGGGYHLPELLNKFGSPLAGFFCGMILSGFTAYVIAVSPLHKSVAENKYFADGAVGRMYTLTRVVDGFSFQSVPSGTRMARLNQRIVPLEVKQSVNEENAQ